MRKTIADRNNINMNANLHNKIKFARKFPVKCCDAPISRQGVFALQLCLHVLFAKLMQQLY